MAKEEISFSGRFAGTIERKGGKYVMRTARAIEAKDGEKFEYETRHEAYVALQKWSRS